MGYEQPQVGVGALLAPGHFQRPTAVKGIGQVARGNAGASFHTRM